MTSGLNLSGGTDQEKNLFAKKKHFILDIAGNNRYQFRSTAFGDNNKDELGFNIEILKKILNGRKASSFLLGKSKQGRNIEAWYFPGSSDKRALVIGGVHGTELSAIEVAATLIKTLKSGGNNYYSVIIIPCLFPG